MHIQGRRATCGGNHLINIHIAFCRVVIASLAMDLYIHREGGGGISPMVHIGWCWCLRLSGSQRSSAWLDCFWCATCSCWGVDSWPMAISVSVECGRRWTVRKYLILNSAEHNFVAKTYTPSLWGGVGGWGGVVQGGILILFNQN